MVDRRLGRGLDFFLSGGKAPASPNPRVEGSVVARAAQDEVLHVDIEKLQVSPFQPRKVLGEAELNELAESIRASGILQPILARRVGDKLEIVAGERRWRAAKIAGLTQVPVLLRTVSDQDSAVFGLVENLQREDLNAIEKALGFQSLQKVLGGSQDDLARKVGLERSTVANFLRLLDLPEAVQAHVSRGTLSMGHARCLLALPDAEAMTRFADSAIQHAWSVRALEAKVREALEASKGDKRSAAAGKQRPVWLNELEESLVEALGTPVAIRYGRKRSQIVIDCAGRDEFERVFQRLKNA
jgi:ParB family transcriptional regulator, chromosome partitioning protein